MNPFNLDTQRGWRKKAYRNYLIEELATICVLLSNCMLLIFIWCISYRSPSHHLWFKRMTAHPLLLAFHGALLIGDIYVGWHWIRHIPTAIYRRLSIFHPLSCTFYLLWFIAFGVFIYGWGGSY